MRVTFADLWTPSGSVDRGTYVLVGVVGFALKHNLDRFTATLLFHRPWSVFNYWEPIRNAGRITSLHPDEAKFLATLVATALPFIWIGVTMTLKRLRSIGAPAAYVILFFVPIFNLLLFLVLSIIPSRVVSTAPIRHESWLARLVPESFIGSATVAILLTALVGGAAAVFGALFLVNYGWGLFIALPFTMGFAAAAIHGIRQQRSLAASIAVAVLSALLLGCGMLAFAMEGIVCLIWLFHWLFHLRQREEHADILCKSDGPAQRTLLHFSRSYSCLLPACSGSNTSFRLGPRFLSSAHRSRSKPRRKKSGRK